MSKRRPLVITAQGDIKQLPLGDVMPGRPQNALAAATALALNTDHHDTLAVARTYTFSGTPENDDVVALHLIVTAESVVTFPASRRSGSTGKIVALEVPIGNHELNFKRINGEWWLADSCGEVTETPYTSPTVATPAFDVPAGSYAATQNVTITCATSGADVYYTTDGSTPSSSSTLYTGPVAISASATLKAKAFKTDYTPSAVQSAAYVIDTTAPTLSGAPNVNAAGNQITVPLSEACVIGTGGNGGWAVDTTGAALTLTFASFSGNNVLLTPSRTILRSADETLSNLRYTQPGNGVEDATVGNDLATFSGVAVTNNSTQVAGGSPPVPTIGRWKFNEGIGTTVAADVGPNAGTNAAWGGGGIRFNGTGTIVQTGAVVDMGGAAQVAFGFWINRDDVAALQILFETGAVWDTLNRSFIIYVNAGELHVGIRDASGGSLVKKCALGHSAQHLVLVTMDQAAGAIAISIDDVAQSLTLVGSNTHAGGTTFANYVLNMGARADTTSPASAYVDDVCIFSGALTSGEETAHFVAGPQ
jgi:hypothetical protein